MTMRQTAAALAVLATALSCRPAPGGQAPDSRAEAADPHRAERDVIHVSPDMQRDLRLATASVTERRGSQQVAMLGEVAADQTRYAEVAAPADGLLTQVLADTNQSVSAGAPLAQLRSTELGRARAAVQTAVARRDLARQTVERKRTLAAERIVAAREVEEAEATARAAAAEAEAAATALQALGASADESDPQDPALFYLRAPIAGQVLERRAVLGRFVGPSDPLFVIADLSRIWVVVQAFERDAVNVRPGAVAHVTLAALPGEEHDGRVGAIGQQVEAGSRTVPIRIALDNAARVMRPGMSASVRLEVGGGSATVLTVPAAALQRVGDRWLAFVPRSEHEYEMRPVGRGRDLGGDVEVVSGLAAGDTVVVEGAYLLKAEAEKRGGGADEHGH